MTITMIMLRTTMTVFKIIIIIVMVMLRTTIKTMLRNLKEEDKIFPAGPLGNYSLAGFEMVTC